MVNAENSSYRYMQDGSRLTLDPYFSLSKVYKWKSPLTEVIVMVPEGKYIDLDPNTRYFLDDIDDWPSPQVQKAAGETLIIKEGAITISD